MYKFENALINGANGGLGSQFAEELLKCGASKVFVTYRSDTGAGVQSGKLARLRSGALRSMGLRLASASHSWSTAHRYR